jgi:hypothetical protein
MGALLFALCIAACIGLAAILLSGGRRRLLPWN